MKKSDLIMMSASVALFEILLIGCTSSPAKRDSVSASPSRATSSPASELPDLARAMDRLETAIEKPASPFHVSFKKTQSDGFLYQCEADVSPDGIIGQQTDSSPITKIGDDVFPARTSVRKINGTPFGSLDWSTARGGIVMGYLNGSIGDAQPGVKYAGDERSGGYDAGRYNFDLAGIDADIKKALGVGNALGTGRQVKDFNMKGSAWIAKDTGQMVKFQFDSLWSFTNGENSSTHYEGLVTKK